jgi:hypothetical protein
VSGANLHAVSFGHGAGADCVRFVAQTAVDLDARARSFERDIGAACDALAEAGGVARTSNQDVIARCDAAVAAISTAPAYAAMRPFRVTRNVPPLCVLGPLIACGACASTPRCNEASSEDARAKCSLPALEIHPARTPDDTPGVAALAAVQTNLPTLDYATARSDALLTEIGDFEKIAASQLGPLGLRGDLRGVECIGRSSALLVSTNVTYNVASSQANRIEAALVGRGP